MRLSTLEARLRVIAIGYIHGRVDTSRVLANALDETRLRIRDFFHDRRRVTDLDAVRYFVGSRRISRDVQGPKRTLDITDSALSICIQPRE
jgi:hypothetical protein